MNFAETLFVIAFADERFKDTEENEYKKLAENIGWWTLNRIHRVRSVAASVMSARRRIGSKGCFGGIYRRQSSGTNIAET